MKKKTLPIRLVVLLAAMMCALGAAAAEAYACYYLSTLTFYYDNLRSSRTGTTYDLNTGSNDTGWDTDDTKSHVTKVVFDPSFADARPTTTYDWFYLMKNLLSIKGLYYLNTSEVTNMAHMFNGCSLLNILDVSHFNTSKVTDMRSMFRDCSRLTSLDVGRFNTSRVTNMYGMFDGCSSLRTIYAGSGWSTAAVTNSTYMFYGCTSLVGGQGTTYDYSHTDKAYAHIDGGTSNPGYFTDINTTMPYACYTPSNTTLTFYYDNQRSSRTGRTYDLNTDTTEPDWKIDGTNASVTKVVFDPSFAGARPTSTFGWFWLMINLESITGLNYLNTSEVTNMRSMFSVCRGLTSLDLSHFNTSKVTDMSFMFMSCSDLTSLDLGHFDTSKVTNMDNMFDGCSNLKSLDLSHFNTSKVTDMSFMFVSCSGLTSLDLGHFDTSKVTNMDEMFGGCSNLTSLDLSSFNTSKVTDMGYMFIDCQNLSSLDLSSFNTSKVTEMDYMFYGCNILRTIYVGQGWSTAAVTNSTGMFSNCYDLVGGQGTTYNANHVDAAYAHIDGGTSNPGYFTAGTEAYACYTPSNTTLTFYYDNQRIIRTGRIYDLNTENNDTGWDTDGTKSYVTKVVFDPSFAAFCPTTTYDWFYGMENLQSITGMKEYLNTSEVTNMAHMFNGCSRLNILDVSHFNTSKVTDMRSMFRNCSSLTSLDLSSFNTSKVTDIYNMFYGCSSLRTIYAGSGWSTAAVTNSTYMFYGCTSLVGGQGTTYSSSHVDAAYAHIDGGPSNPGYFTTGTEAYACFYLYDNTLTFYYDNLRSSRPGTTFDLNTDYIYPDWQLDYTKIYVNKVVFDPSFAAARPTSTFEWFFGMENLQFITGMKEYLNTSEVTNMSWMFMDCIELTSLDVSHFNTSKVTNMDVMFAYCEKVESLDLSNFNTSNLTGMVAMFEGCTNLRTIYVGSDWSTPIVTYSDDMFLDCTSLVGGQGTTYDENHIDAAYAHIDGGPSYPGYFTEKPPFTRGDVNDDGDINIADVTALINYLLSHNPAGVNLQGADTTLNGIINITDVTFLINYLLSHSWP